MKFCKECGKEMFDDAMICPNCGTYQTELKKADEIVEAAEEMLPADVEMPVDPIDEMDSLGLSDTAVNTPVPSFEVDANKADTQGNAYQGSVNNAYQGNMNNTYRGSSYQGNMNQGTSYQGTVYTYGGDADSGDTRFNAPGAGSSYHIQKYNFWLYLLLGIVTCGIFNIYYMYKWTEDTNRLSQGVYEPSMNYIYVFLLGIVTCGIYPLVWTYQQGERLKVVGDANGIQVRETGVHHLLISLLLGGVGALVSQYIFFSNTNRLAGVYNGDMTRDQANMKTSHVPAIIIGVIVGILGISTFVGTAIYSARNIDFDNMGDSNNYIDLNDLDDWDDWDNLDDIDWDNFNIDGMNGVVSGEPSANFNESFLEIKGAIKIQDINGDPALAVSFYWENKGDDAENALWQFDIEAYQGSEYLEMTWPAMDDPDVDTATYTEDIKPGESNEFWVVFKLENETENIDVVAREFLSDGNQTAVCTFTID